MQPFNLNRALNRLSITIHHLANQVSRRIGRLGDAAQRDIDQGAVNVQSALDRAYQEARDDLDAALRQAEETIERERENPPTPTGEGLRGRKPRWQREAEEEYPGVAFNRGGFEICPDGEGHDSAIFSGIDEAIDYAQDIPVLWWISSNDDGHTFFVTVCDNSGTAAIDILIRADERAQRNDDEDEE